MNVEHLDVKQLRDAHIRQIFEQKRVETVGCRLGGQGARCVAAYLYFIAGPGRQRRL